MPDVVGIVAALKWVTGLMAMTKTKVIYMAQEVVMADELDGDLTK